MEVDLLEIQIEDLKIFRWKIYKSSGRKSIDLQERINVRRSTYVHWEDLQDFQKFLSYGMRSTDLPQIDVKGENLQITQKNIYRTFKIRSSDLLGKLYRASRGNPIDQLVQDLKFFIGTVYRSKIYTSSGKISNDLLEKDVEEKMCRSFRRISTDFL